jgi:hypothetical protein
MIFKGNDSVLFPFFLPPEGELFYFINWAVQLCNKYCSHLIGDGGTAILGQLLTWSKKTLNPQTFRNDTGVQQSNHVTICILPLNPMKVGTALRLAINHVTILILASPKSNFLSLCKF